MVNGDPLLQPTDISGFFRINCSEDRFVRRGCRVQGRLAQHGSAFPLLCAGPGVVPLPCRRGPESSMSPECPK
jgi:hypothetical protein